MIPSILQVGDVLISSDIITRKFCCDLSSCKGCCCVEGDAGAPVTMDEIMRIEDILDDVWSDLGATAQSLIDTKGVAYPDPEGEMVTQIVNGRDCVFCCTGDDGCTLCALERRTKFKPVSCALYPIREKTIGEYVCLNYHRWEICRPAEELGSKLNLPVYKFLKGPLTRRFGEEWYAELEALANEILLQK